MISLLLYRLDSLTVIQLDKCLLRVSIPVGRGII